MYQKVIYNTQLVINMNFIVKCKKRNFCFRRDIINDLEIIKIY